MITKDELLLRIAAHDPAYVEKPGQDYQCVSYTATLEALSPGEWIVSTTLGQLLVTTNLTGISTNAKEIQVSFEYYKSCLNAICWIRVATNRMEELAAKYRCFNYVFVSDYDIAEKFIEHKL